MADTGKLVVARFHDGRTVKGRLVTFHADERLEIREENRNLCVLHMDELKALFFVRSLSGDAKREDHQHLPEHELGGIKTWIEFPDGEVLAGWQTASRPLDPGIYLFPVDPDSNLEKVYVLRKALRRVLEGEPATKASAAHQNVQPFGGGMVSQEDW